LSLVLTDSFWTHYVGHMMLRGQPSPTHMQHYEVYADMWHSLKH